jgi:hypothetical protein
MEINSLGMIYGTKRALELMTPRGRGHVVNICSAMGEMAVPGLAVYNASKAAAVLFTDSTRTPRDRGTSLGRPARNGRNRTRRRPNQPTRNPGHYARAGRRCRRGYSGEREVASAGLRTCVVGGPRTRTKLGPQGNPRSLHAAARL